MYGGSTENLFPFRLILCSTVQYSTVRPSVCLSAPRGCLSVRLSVCPCLHPSVTVGPYRAQNRNMSTLCAPLLGLLDSAARRGKEINV